MDLHNVVIHQISHMFPVSKKDLTLVEKYIEIAEKQALQSLNGFRDDSFISKVNPLNSVTYCNFLYWLGRSLYRDQFSRLADMVYYLNKSLNCVELYYEVELPAFWSCEHPLGSVMGKAEYGEYFFFYQGCTVGGNRKGRREEIRYPQIGKNVIMYSNSKILGNSKIGDQVVLAANTYVINEIIPDNVTVFGQSPNLIIKENKTK